MFNQSLVSLFGLLFGEHLRSLGQGTVGAALIMNINSVVLNFSGKTKKKIISLDKDMYIYRKGNAISNRSSDWTGTENVLGASSGHRWQFAHRSRAYIKFDVNKIVAHHHRLRDFRWTWPWLHKPVLIFGRQLIFQYKTWSRRWFGISRYWSRSNDNAIRCSHSARWVRF